MSTYRTCGGPHGCGRQILASLWDRAASHAPGCRIRRSILAKQSAACRKARLERKAAETRRARREARAGPHPPEGETGPP